MFLKMEVFQNIVFSIERTCFFIKLDVEWHEIEAKICFCSDHTIDDRKRMARDNEIEHGCAIQATVCKETSTYGHTYLFFSARSIASHRC